MELDKMNKHEPH